MMFSSSLRRLSLALACVSFVASAAIGKVAALDGKAWRYSGDASTADSKDAPPLDEGKKVVLAVGSDIELGDNVVVDGKSAVKLALNDESVLALGENSRLWVSKASFENLDHRSFSAKLWFGKVWAKVNKALSGSDAKFEVTTPRAVAGVRGTIFRVDATKILSAASKPHVGRVVVKVTEGKVAVEGQGKKGSTEPELAPGATKGARHQVSGPTQISADEWEKKFVELQAKQEVEISEAGDWKSKSFEPDAEKDALAMFVKKHP